MENISAIIEALILASEAPLGLDKIYSVLEGTDKALIRESLDNLIADYERREGGITIGEVAGGYQFRTRPEVSGWVKKLKSTKPPTLSAAALETLAIVAYRQPVIKSEIEAVRGVDSGAALKSLLEKKLVRIVGRKDVPGRPIIYGTTRKFLEVFNLRELTDLPSMRELREITEQQGVLELEEVPTHMALHQEELKEAFPEKTVTTENDDNSIVEPPTTITSLNDLPREPAEAKETVQALHDADTKVIESAPEEFSGSPPQDDEETQKRREDESTENEVLPQDPSQDDIDL